MRFLTFKISSSKDEEYLKFLKVCFQWFQYILSFFSASSPSSTITSDTWSSNTAVLTSQTLRLTGPLALTASQTTSTNGKQYILSCRHLTAIEDRGICFSQKLLSSLLNKFRGYSVLKQMHIYYGVIRLQ